MTETTNTTVESTTADSKPARKRTSTKKVTASTKKATAKKPSTKKASAKKSTAKKSSASSDNRTVRVRALEAIKRGKEMTAPEVKEAIGLSHGLKPTLDQEVERGHLAYTMTKGEANVATYKITAKGIKALEDGTVNPSRSTK